MQPDNQQLPPRSLCFSIYLTNIINCDSINMSLIARTHTIAYCLIGSTLVDSSMKKL